MRLQHQTVTVDGRQIHRVYGSYGVVEYQQFDQLPVLLVHRPACFDGCEHAEADTLSATGECPGSADCPVLETACHWEYAPDTEAFRLVGLDPDGLRAALAELYPQIAPPPAP